MRPSPPVSSFGTRAFARIRFRLDPMPPLYAPQPWARSPVPSWSRPMRGWKTVATKRGSCVRVFPRISRQLMLRAASSPTTTTTASGLVRTAVADIIASIGAVGAGARLLQSGLLLSFDDGVGTVSVPGGAVSANKAAFIEESAPIPVNDLVATEATLLPHKLSSIFTLTSEMVSGSNAEALIADAKLRCVGLALDNVRFECQWRQCYPTAGLRYNVRNVAKIGGPIAVVVALERAITLSLRLPSGVRVWLAVGRTDMRRGMKGLALQVQEALGRDPHAGDLYVFRGVPGSLA